MAVASRPPQSAPAAAGRPVTTRRLGARALPGKAIVPLLIALAIALQGSCRRDTREDVDAIRGLVAREADATNAKDLKALTEVWSQDKGILLFDVPPPGRFEGWEQIGRLFKDFFDRFSEVRLTFDNIRVEVEGGIGYATYDWAMTGRMGEYALDDRGQATAIYRKEKAGWRLVHAHYSSLPPASTDQTAAAAAPATPGQAGPAQPGSAQAGAAKAGPTRGAPKPTAPGSQPVPSGSPAGAPAGSASPGPASPPR
jgi:ketosteroid isomerase-like protein